MRHTKATQFDNDWEYEQAKKQERKRAKLTRKNRQAKYTGWQEIA